VPGGIGPPEALTALDVATIDAFLNAQRRAIAGTRQRVESRADMIWRALPEPDRAAFRVASDGVPCPADVAESAAYRWRRAAWIAVIGGTPRAPFEVATPPETAITLQAAIGGLATIEIDALRQAFDTWWTAFQELARRTIAERVRERIEATAARVHAGPAQSPDSARRRRIANAESKMVNLHRQLDDAFRPLAPVCGACTRETGGCCTITVPLLWREADFHLLGTGSGDVPDPVAMPPGACPFLGTDGCRVASERRPYICRTFL
jgi:hypothetical protein